MEESLTAKLREKLGATYIEVKDESMLHQGHREGGSGHYHITIVSPLFSNYSRIEQHRKVYQALAEEIGQTIHALKIKSFTPEEWREQ